MYQTFTGKSRRPRQVNLSGRPSNPFATAFPGNPQAAIATAQQDRLQRQQQREQVQASSHIQKVWRGHRDRRKTYDEWRRAWDQEEETSLTADGRYKSPEQSLKQIRRLLLFYQPEQDTKRLAWYGMRQLTTADAYQCNNGPWSWAYSRLCQACTKAARVRADREQDAMLLTVMGFAARRTTLSTHQALAYYDALAHMRDAPVTQLQNALVAPLNTSSSEAYVGLATLLATPLDPDMVALLRSIVNVPSLATALKSLPDSVISTERAKLWLLGNVLGITDDENRPKFFDFAAKLLGELVDYVVFEGEPVKMENVAFDREILAPLSADLPLNEYLHEQTSALIEMNAVRNLLVREEQSNGKAQSLAGYALTLLRCFPTHADDIRMWLYLGSSNSNTDLSATRYFWRAVQSSALYRNIQQNPRSVLTILKTSATSLEDKNEWTVILVFIELYTFMLKIMDDEDFMGGATVAGGRNSAIPIGDVSDLVLFLKNLGFTLYFDVADLRIAGQGTARNRDMTNLSRYFGKTDVSAPPRHSEEAPMLIAGLPGITIDHLKGIVTGLLRAIYERDSRRHFLPSGHWLMTSRFDMAAFIPGVVSEEQNRHVVQDADAEDEYDDEDDYDQDDASRDIRVGGRGHASVLRAQAIRERAQRKASRKRYLEAVAPRLEILQNMPFFIPFNTRVEIFREFVLLDQTKRRHGHVDPDMWRHFVIQMQRRGDQPPHAILERQHAKIRRKNEFMDAFDHFYDLGASLKEPIQITFVDEFEMPEAGIDGGGVTKEFLTSVINQVFHPEDGQIQRRFFIENSTHLLYPAPTIVEDLRLQLKSMRLQDEAATIHREIKSLLQQYEFLGRIIGKCMYEGILVDVTFAGFFLKKWALTGGANSAPLESGYRANINDLRELDAELYKGLLAVKNATAEELEAFDLTFTVDELIGHGDQQQVVERELVPNGHKMAVTPENKLLYVNRMSRYRLQGQSAVQTNAFLKGLSSIIQPSWLSMFNQTELQTLIGGASAEIDVGDLRRNTLYGGTYVIGDDGEEHPSIKLFWDVMASLPDRERRKVLKFVTSTPRGPLLGFNNLEPRFSIRDSGSDENRYPTTSTCVNLLKLPMYKTEAVLRERLLAAVNSGAGFDLS